MPSRSIDISRLVVFGDSLSDNGNLFRLTGFPPPPAWDGRFSNGPTYAEQLAQFLHVPLDDRAFGFAKASKDSPSIDPTTPAVPNVSDQVTGYIAQLNGNRAPHDTTALINIGSNDYLGYLESELPKDFQSIQNFAASVAGSIASVVGSIKQEIHRLTDAGVEKIILFTLPDLGITPFAQSHGVVGVAHDLFLANNIALKEMVQKLHHPNVQVVDVFQLSEALFADPHSFGFNNLNQMWVTGSTQFAPNEVAFFDDVHPTTALHGISAAFADAVLTSDHVQFLDGTQSVIHAQHGNNFIFAAPPIDPSNPGLNDHYNYNYTIYGGPGTDLIFAGSGKVKVYGGSGTDLIAAGSGNATLVGGSGTDVLETNSTGRNVLMGGQDDDALIVNRGGTNKILGGSGNDLFILKENASLFNPDGTFNFGKQEINGGNGRDTLRFIINDRNSSAESALRAEFVDKVESAFKSAANDHHAGTFQVDGLCVTGIERIELQVDSVSTDNNTPYLITHDIVRAEGHAAPVSSTLSDLLQTADSWNLLSVSSAGVTLYTPAANKLLAGGSGDVTPNAGTIVDPSTSVFNQIDPPTDVPVASMLATTPNASGSVDGSTALLTQYLAAGFQSGFGGDGAGGYTTTPVPETIFGEAPLLTKPTT